MSYNTAISTLHVFNSKKEFIYKFKNMIHSHGGAELWVLNKNNGEIYRFKGTQISDFDVTIELYNELEQEFVFSSTFVLHMKEKIVEFFEEVPGKVYLKKIECYRELYKFLTDKVGNLKCDKLKREMEDKIEFIEYTFPEFLI